MIPLINKTLMKLGCKWILAPTDDILDLMIRANAYAVHINNNLEPGQIAHYNADTHQVEVGMKH